MPGKGRRDTDHPLDGAPLKIIILFGKLVYLTIAVSLLVTALMAIAIGFWDAWRALAAGEGLIGSLLNAIGLSVLSLAVIDVSKYLMDEEVIRHRELRETREARGALTKFLTIITIAVCLEALVYIFQAGKSDMSELIYPSLLLISASTIFIGLGVYQWLSARTERQTGAKG